MLNSFETKISGIPCIIRVDYVVGAKPFRGSAYQCDSSDDYYGYCDIAFTVLDRKGYVANWLRNKMTAKDVTRIEQEILSQ